MKYKTANYQVVEGEPNQATFCSTGTVVRAPFNSKQHPIGYKSDNWVNFKNTYWTPISDEDFAKLPTDEELYGRLKDYTSKYLGIQFDPA